MSVFGFLLLIVMQLVAAQVPIERSNVTNGYKVYYEVDSTDPDSISITFTVFSIYTDEGIDSPKELKEDFYFTNKESSFPVSILIGLLIGIYVYKKLKRYRWE